MTREQLEAYAANPNNFSKEQWEALQKVKEACDKYKREARARIGEEQFDQKVEKQRKKQPQRGSLPERRDPSPTARDRFWKKLRFFSRI